jgi:hypothetical protein
MQLFQVPITAVLRLSVALLPTYREEKNERPFTA